MLDQTTREAISYLAKKYITDCDEGRQDKVGTIYMFCTEYLQNGSYELELVAFFAVDYKKPGKRMNQEKQGGAW